MTDKPCEYCGAPLPKGVDKQTRQIRSHHFDNCGKRLEQRADENVSAALAEPTCKDDLQVAEPVAWQYVWSLGMCFTTDSLATLHNYVQGAEDRLPPEKRGYVRALYTTPPRREWHGLTDEEITELWMDTLSEIALGRAIETALRAKNRG